MKAKTTKANPFKIELEENIRGFKVGEFSDRRWTDCSIAESSIETESCLWLGVSLNRMHLTVDMAAALIPHLQKFVDTGHL